MSRMIPPPNSRATGVGALPHTDPMLACSDVLDIFPEIPYVPTLPDRGLLESIVFNDSAQLPGQLIREDRCCTTAPRDNTAAMEQVYLDFVEENFSPYGLDRSHASAFTEMMTRPFPHAQMLKCQVTGRSPLGCRLSMQTNARSTTIPSLPMSSRK